MSWIENMSINIFPMVLVMVVFVSSRFKFGKTISARDVYKRQERSA